MLTVKELKQLAKNLTPDDLRKQLGPFVVLQRPDERTLMARQPFHRFQTVSVPNRAALSPAAVLLQFDELTVTTLPPVADTDRLMVGRGADCELVVDDPSVSNHHAQLRWNGDARKCSALDLGSMNGTMVNADSLGDKEAVLQDGDRLRFGDADFCYFRTETLAALLVSPSKP